MGRFLNKFMRGVYYFFAGCKYQSGFFSPFELAQFLNLG